MHVNIHTVGPRNQIPDRKWAERRATALTLLLVGGSLVGLGADGYNRVLVPNQIAQAVVTEEVHFKFLDSMRPNSRFARNRVTLELTTGPDAGKEGKAYFHLKSNAEDFKKGEVVDVTYEVRRLTGSVLIEDLKRRAGAEYGDTAPKSSPEKPAR